MLLVIVMFFLVILRGAVLLQIRRSGDAAAGDAWPVESDPILQEVTGARVFIKAAVPPGTAVADPVPSKF